MITGFLGSGKTTFLKNYSQYFINQGKKVGILENDYGAVNVDMLLLNELRGDKCELEMVAGGCDSDCHRRRFKTKLIAMGMGGYDRVIIEPSGVFDMDEFFDSLRDEPLDNWYEIGSVITVVDPKAINGMNANEKRIFESEVASAGTIVLSRVDIAEESDISGALDFLEEISQKLECKKSLKDICLIKTYSELCNQDYERISKSGYHVNDRAPKINMDEMGYSAVYFLEPGLKKEELLSKLPRLFSDESFGKVLRVKGFVKEGGIWQQVNATQNETYISSQEAGQDVFIVIGSNLNQEIIEAYIGSKKA